MAPVGSRESLAAAIHAGADSIYFGIESLNMRARSANTFTVDDLREIAKVCDENGVKSYLTVNTIIYDEDGNVKNRRYELKPIQNICSYKNIRHFRRNSAICTGRCFHRSCSM